MESENRVVEFRTLKRASFDGKSYVIRLPSEVVRFLKERGISVEDMVLEGIWKLKERIFGVLMIFGNSEGSAEQETTQGKDNHPDDANDYLVLKDDRGPFVKD